MYNTLDKGAVVSYDKSCMYSKVSSLVFLQYLTTVFDNIQEAIFLIGVEPNDSFRLLLSNEGFFQGTGYPRTVIGKLIKEIVQPASYDKLLKRYKQAIKTKKPQEYIDSFDVPLGRQTYEIKLIPIFNAVGECVQIAAITRNVTELHRLRKRVKQLEG